MKIYLSLLLSFSFCGAFSQEFCKANFTTNTNVAHRPQNSVSTVPILNSFPRSGKVIFLDFDGAVTRDFWWYDGRTIISEPSGLTEAEIEEVFERVAEDFSPFDINVTTDSTVFDAAQVHHKMRVIITPTSWWMQGVTGAAMNGSFSSIFNNNTPCFVFTDRTQYVPRYVAESASHQVGHTLGLYHQSFYDNNCNLTQESYEGVGPVSSEISWAPIMGNSSLRNHTTWSNGYTINCTTTQDNIAVIRSKNGISFRPRPAVTTHTLNNPVTIKEVLLPNDIDSFYLVVPRLSTVTVDCKSGGNTDTRIRLNGVAANDPVSLNSGLSITLNAGTYLLEVSGADNEYLPNYGNTGLFELKIVAATPTVVALNDNKLFANATGVSWYIEMHAFDKVMLQKSSDGINFTDVSLSHSPAGSYQYTALNTTYFRNKVFLTNGTVLYSNIAVMRGRNEKWMLYDISGRLIRTGTGEIDRFGLPSGQYIIRSAGRSERVIY